jgi:excinuclease ABC subunit A
MEMSKKNSNAKLSIKAGGFASQADTSLRGFSSNWSSEKYGFKITDAIETIPAEEREMILRWEENSLLI